MKYITYKEHAPINLERITCIQRSFDDDKWTILFHIDNIKNIRWSFESEIERDLVFRKILNEEGFAKIDQNPPMKL